MEISISAVSRNRKFTKALIRHSATVDSIRHAFEGMGAEMLPFDVLQVVFIDRNQDYVHPVGCREDRIFQVEVAVPNEAETDYSNPSSLVQAVGKKVLLAIESTGLSDGQKESVVQRVGMVLQNL